MNVNFFWSGDNFQFLNRLTIITHIVVGHDVKIWLKGKRPDSVYWIDDLPEVEILDANDIYNKVRDKNRNDRELRIFSDLWSFYFLQQTGEYYADVDAIAIDTWPDKDIVLATYGEPVVAIGVIRLPKNHVVLDKCIKTHRDSWGAVKRFTRCCNTTKLKPTVPDYMFYPILPGKHNDSIVMKCKGKILDPIDKHLRKHIDKGSVSIHYYSNKVSNVGITHEWLDKPELKDSLMNELVVWTQSEYTWSLTNKCLQ